ncbi:MAG: Smr/MutS family protein, partial [Bacteroidales bacterium]|nr:Smr/MutS family protein [Bacteroidales bacterium]
KEAKADAEKTKAARLLLQQKKAEIEKVTMVPIKKPLPKPTVAPQKTKTVTMNQETLNDKIRVGDTVLITNSQTVGEVIELNGNNISVAFKSIVFRTTLKSVEKISRKEARGVKRSSGGKIDNQLFSDAINKKIGQFNQTLDIRGQYAEEAITLLENYLDEAILLGIKNVSILHGKGNGILRKVVRQYLFSRREVKNFADEAIELGGAGITTVQIS